MENNKTKQDCLECKKQFEYEMKPGYPRKYCPACSAIKKAAYEAKSAEPTQSPENQNIDAGVKGASQPLMSARDVNITAQCLTKCMYNVKAPDSPKEVLDAYRFFVLELENNG